ncbi:unnamed protein product, partial [Closterium sp. Naga37s-1]
MDLGRQQPHDDKQSVIPSKPLLSVNSRSFSSMVKPCTSMETSVSGDQTSVFPLEEPSAAPRSPQPQSPPLTPLESQEAGRSRWSFAVVNVFL